jgi:XTP/dITP diphosphohydrolase
MELIIASNNQHKVAEIQGILDNSFNLKTLKEAGIAEEIPETADTIDGNALLKARYVFNKTKINCFADDTGLEVDALNGGPGVYSARYAGENATFEMNNQKLLSELKGVENRKAKFKTIIALIKNGKEHLFEGVVDGEIIESYQGFEGFGYDPIFKPLGLGKTYAEMGLEEKNKMSHRYLAVKKLVEFLTGQSI